MQVATLKSAQAITHLSAAQHLAAYSLANLILDVYLAISIRILLPSGPRVLDAMDAGRRRLALDLRVLRLRVALTRPTWLAENESGVSKAGVAGENGSCGAANAEGGGPALHGVLPLLLLPTTGLQPGFGVDRLEGIVVGRTCEGPALPVKSMLAPSGSTLSLMSSSLRAFSSSVVSPAARCTVY